MKENGIPGTRIIHDLERIKKRREEERKEK